MSASLRTPLRQYLPIPYSPLYSSNKFIAMKLIYCFLLLLCPYCNRAQTAIHIGETVPDINIPRVYNYPDSVIQLSKFKTKLTIIDFWTTTCGSCIQSFPAMRALKKKFGNSLQIFFVDNVTSDTKFKADKLFTRLQTQSGESFTFPYALQDTQLTSCSLILRCRIVYGWTAT